MMGDSPGRDISSRGFWGFCRPQMDELKGESTIICLATQILFFFICHHGKLPCRPSSADF
jgi:hypothetical protein